MESSLNRVHCLPALGRREVPDALEPLLLLPGLQDRALHAVIRAQFADDLKRQPIGRMLSFKHLRHVQVGSSGVLIMVHQVYHLLHLPAEAMTGPSRLRLCKDVLDHLSRRGRATQVMPTDIE